MNQRNLDKPIPDDAWPRIFAELAITDRREAEVLRLVMQFETDRAMARRLGLARNTVSGYVRRLRGRVGAGNRSELTARIVELAHRIRSGGGGHHNTVTKCTLTGSH
ncbi:MAG: helix-turn-helix transcriptional regulator [Thermoguttaceae bacterium]|jgi:DNA-binding CsgD family transcriptional regulator|nr:helix-turn-helix transcriptional regulator [Thermoguttaceae bacterium]